MIRAGSLIVAVVWLIPASAVAGTIRVPEDQPTIQAGIDAAVAGDTVLVADGTYSGPGYWDLEFGASALVLKSENGPDGCIIDCQDGTEQHRAITVRGAHDTTSIITGFSIQNGHAPPVPELGDARRGGAILCLDGASPLISNCHLLQDFAFHGGGGLACDASSPLVVGCVFDACEVSGNGGALWANNSTHLSIRECQFSGNIAQTTNFGCLFATEDTALCSLTISNSTFTNNSALYGFGACVSAAVSELAVKGCQFAGNSNSGSSSTLSAGHAEVDSCTFVAGAFGHFAPSAISVGSGSITSSVITGCRRFGPAGALLRLGDVDLAAVTIVNNQIDTLIAAETNVDFDRVVVAFNQGGMPTLSRRTAATVSTSSVVVAGGAGTVQCTDVFGNLGGDWIGELAGFAGINGNLSLDPLFCDTARSDFHIEDGSPCRGDSGCGRMGALPVNCAGSVLDTVWLEGEVADHVVGNTPRLHWRTDGSLVLSRLEVEVGSDTDWTFAENWSTGESQSADTFITYAGSSLTDGLGYHGRVRVGDSLYWSRWLEAGFRMNSPPGQPILVSPAQMSKVVVNPASFRAVVGSDPEWDLQRLQFAIIQDDSLVVDESPLLPPAQATAGDSIPWNGTTTLLENGFYGWSVRATDGYETTGYWPVMSTFFVNSLEQAPAAAVPASPVDDEIVYTLYPEFIWSRAADPDPLDSVTYDFRASADSEFQFVFAVDSLADTLLSDTLSLETARRYWWKVISRDRTGLVTETSAETYRTYRPGDANHNWVLTAADILTIVGYVFKGDTLSVPACTANVDADLDVDVVDIIELVNYLFKAGPEPEAACDGVAQGPD